MQFTFILFLLTLFDDYLFFPLTFANTEGHIEAFVAYILMDRFMRSLNETFERIPTRNNKMKQQQQIRELHGIRDLVESKLMESLIIARYTEHLTLNTISDWRSVQNVP